MYIFICEGDYLDISCKGTKFFINSMSNAITFANHHLGIWQICSTFAPDKKQWNGNRKSDIQKDRVVVGQ